MSTPRNSKVTTLRNKSLVSAAVLATVVALAASPANAMHFGGFGGGHGFGGFRGFGGGHMGGFHGLGGFHSLGGLHPMGGGLSHVTTSGLSHSVGSHSTLARHASGDRDVGGGMRERAGTSRHADRDVGGGMRERAGTGGHEARDFGRGGWDRGRWGRGDSWVPNGDDGDNDWLQYIAGVIADVPVADSVVLPPNSGVSTYNGTTVKVVGIGTDNKTVIRTDKNGKVEVIRNPPLPPVKAANDLGTAITNLVNAAKALSEAKAEAKAARQSLTSIVTTEWKDEDGNPKPVPADVKANYRDAMKRVADADKAVKDAQRAFDQAVIEWNLQVAQGATR